MGKEDMIFLIFIILVHVFSLSKIIFFPYPELFIYPYLTNKGLVPYKDILDQHFPGLMFFPINLGNLGMNTPEIARFWQYGIVIIIHVLLFLVSKNFFKSTSQRLIANGLFLIWHPFFEGWVLWIDTFLPIFILPAIYFIKIKKVFWSGFFLGLALLFKQVILPLIVIIGFYLLFKEKKLKTLLLFGIGVLIPASFLILYIAKLNIWKDFIFWTITFNLTTFAEMGRKYGTLSEWGRVVGVYGFSLFAFLNKKVSEDVILIGVFLIGSLASIYARFDFVHLQPSLPLIALLSVFSISWLFKRKYLKVLIIIYILAIIFLLTRFYKGHLGNKTLFFGNVETNITAAVQKYSQEGEKIFAIATLPHIYYMANRLPSGNIFVFQFPWFMIEAENRVLSGIVDDPPKVVVRDTEAKVEDVKLTIYTPKINEYVNSNYKVINKVNGIEIMIKK